MIIPVDEDPLQSANVIYPCGKTFSHHGLELKLTHLSSSSAMPRIGFFLFLLFFYNKFSCHRAAMSASVARGLDLCYVMLVLVEKTKSLFNYQLNYRVSMRMPSAPWPRSIVLFLFSC